MEITQSEVDNALKKIEWITMLATETRGDIPGTPEGLHELLIQIVIDVAALHESLSKGSVSFLEEDQR